MKRRDFLRVSATGVAASAMGGIGLLSWAPRANAATINKTFYITEGYIEQPDGTNVYFRGFSGDSNSLSVPGESMIVQEGDTVNITIINTLSSRHNFTIDGLVDSGSIRGGRSSSFSFIANKVGSHLFYDALNAPYNRLVGLHGAIAVMPKDISNELYVGSPQFVQQYFWIFNDIDPVWHDEIRRGRTPTTKYIPRYFTINGLSGRPPGAAGAHDPNIDAMTDPRTALHGHIGDRTLIRMFNVGKASQSVHTHANHMEWLTENGQIRPDIWEKDCIYLEANKGAIDSIFPFHNPVDAYPPVSTGTYPMHPHTEMSQTSAGGSYMFGAMTDIYFE